MSQEERSEALIDVLQELEQSDIGFVLVGGYAISQFEMRFSTDLDLVIAPDDYETVVEFLEARNFERMENLVCEPEPLTPSSPTLPSECRCKSPESSCYSDSHLGTAN